MDTLYNFFVSNDAFKNVDTLRYFFSAVFQGYAALITLGAMFYLNLQEKNQNLLKILEDELFLLMNDWYGQKSFHKGSNVIIKAKTDFSKPNTEDPGKDLYVRYDRIKDVLTKYEVTEKYFNDLKTIIKSPLKSAVIILFVSLISLGLVGYHANLDIFLLISVFVIISLSFVFFFQLKTVIYTALKS